jgi:hypothetical protein
MSVRRLNDKRAFNIIPVIRAVVLDFVLPITTEMIKAETICFQIDNIQ